MQLSTHESPTSDCPASRPRCTADGAHVDTIVASKSGVAQPMAHAVPMLSMVTS